MCKAFLSQSVKSPEELLGFFFPVRMSKSGPPDVPESVPLFHVHQSVPLTRLARVKLQQIKLGFSLLLILILTFLELGM